MRVERVLARPVFVEEKFRRVFGRNVQIVIQTARLLARWRDEADQSFLQFRFLARPGLKRGDDGDGFHFVCLVCFVVKKWIPKFSPPPRAGFPPRKSDGQSRASSRPQQSPLSA